MKTRSDTRPSKNRLVRFDRNYYANFTQHEQIQIMADMLMGGFVVENTSFTKRLLPKVERYIKKIEGQLL